MQKKEWNQSDKILLSDGLVSATFRYSETVSDATAIFTGQINSLVPAVKCFFPASEAFLRDGKIYTSISSSLNVLSSTSWLSDKQRLIALSNGEEAIFEPAAAFLKLRLNLEEDTSIDDVRIEFPAGISGECTVDFEKGILCDATQKNLTLNFIPSRKKSISADGIQIAPQKAEQLKECILFRVRTNECTYLMARKINHDLLAGHLYEINIDIRDFKRVATREELTDLSYTILQSNGLSLRVVDTTSSTLSVAWSEDMFPKDYSKDLLESHLISLYDCGRNLVLSVNPSSNNTLSGEPVYVYSDVDQNHPPRFVFSGLKPDSEYVLIAQNLSTGALSESVTARTLSRQSNIPVEIASNEGDTIFSEDFSRLLWGGNPSTQSAGYVPGNLSQLSTLEQGRATGEISKDDKKFLYTRHDAKIEPFLFSESLLRSIGMADFLWWSGNGGTPKSTKINAHAGFIGIQENIAQSGILLPKMNALIDSAEIRLKMRISLYGASERKPVLKVALVDRVESSEQFRAAGFEKHAEKVLTPSKEWQQVELSFSGALPSSRLLLSTSASDMGQAMVLVDDITVEFVKYYAASTDSPKVGLVTSTATTLTVEYVNAQKDNFPFKAEIFSDSGCSSLLGSFQMEPSTREEYVKWPARFTFTLLKESTPYYIRITDSRGKKSRVMEFLTSKRIEEPEKCVLCERFDDTCLGGDYINLSMGVNLKDVVAKTFNPSSDEELRSKFSSVQATVDAPLVTSCSEKLLERMGLSTMWDYKRVSVRPGYLKIGDTVEAGALTTPALTALKKENATVRLCFDACSFVGDSAQSGAPSLRVCVLGKDGSVIQEQLIELDARPVRPIWQSFEITFKGLSHQNRIRFESASTTNGRFLLDNIVISSEDALEKDVICGYIKDTSSLPVEGVSVSDGFTVSSTDQSGYFEMIPSSDSWYIFYSIPSGAEIIQNSFGHPDFYQKYEKLKRRYDFTLSMLPKTEESFNLLCLADPQSGSATSTARFRDETIPFIRNFVSKSDLPCYGVTLGDIVSSASTDTTAQFPPMRNLMSFSSAGLFIFQTMGNHDNTYFYGENNPLKIDATSSSINLKAQRKFEDTMGPVNYSWNRGRAHIISMKDIVYNSPTAPSEYSGGFLDEQYEWLKADLERVPRDHLVILCVHIPFASYYKSGRNMSQVLTLLKQFKNVHIMAGHTHYMRLEQSVGGSGIYEHTHSAVCGGWWASNLSADGAPNGFAVYRIEGNSIKNAFFQGVNRGMDARDYQMRVYSGNMLTGGKYEYFRWSLSQNEILTNVFFADPSWSVKVYEDGVYSGDMTRMTQKRYNATQLPKSEPNSKSSPTWVPNDSSQDFWAIGYIVGEAGRDRSSYMPPNYHMYRYTLKKKNSKVVVIATDPYGNKYTSSEIEPSVENGYPDYVKSGNK